MPDSFAPLFSRLNELALRHQAFSLAMLWQSTLVIVAIGLLDALLLRRGRASLRYAVWLLVIAKFLVPVTLPGPLSPLLTAAPVSQPADVETPPTSVSLPRPPVIRREPAEPERDVASPQAMPVPARPRPTLSWSGALFLVWGAGTVVLLALFAREVLRVRRLIRWSRPAGPEWTAALTEVAHLVGMKRPDRVAVRITDELASPALCGWRRGTILIPAELTARLDAEQRRFVLAHELTHWRRRDPQVNTLQTLVQIAYFYNPLLWIVNGVVRRVREYAVDDEAIAAIGATLASYAETLVDIADQSRRRGRLGWSAIEAASHGTLASRVRRLLSRPVPRASRLGRGPLIAILLLGGLLLPMGRLTQRTASADPVPTPVAASAQAAAPGPMPSAPAVQVASVVEGPPAGSVAAFDTEVATELQKGMEAMTPDEQRAFGRPAANEVSGLVVDIDTGRPISGAAIRLASCQKRNETLTSERGVFWMVVPEGAVFEGEVIVSAKAEGFPPDALTCTPGQGFFLIGLSRRAGLVGLITNPAGEPVAGARIRASWTNESASGYPLETEARSGPDGTYRLLLPVSLVGTRNELEGIDVQVSAPGQGVGRADVKQILHDEMTPLSIQLEPAIRFEAKIVDSETGRPAEGFGLYSYARPFFSARSDREGRLILENRPPGQLEVMCGGGEVMKNVDGCADCEGFVGFEPGPYGRWWSPEGTLETMREKHPAGEAWQGNDGVLWFDLRQGMAPVTIFVERSVTISGRITDPEGNPVAGATVSPVRTGKGSPLGGDTGEDRVTDADGRYRLTVPASKNAVYNVAVHDGGYGESGLTWRQWANGVSEPLRTKPGEVIENVDLQLTRPGGVRGRVMRDGKPVAGVTVKAQAMDGRESSYYDPKVVTSAEGTFELKWLRPGKHHLTTGTDYRNKRDESQPDERVIEIEAGELVEGVELKPRPIDQPELRPGPGGALDDGLR